MKPPKDNTKPHLVKINGAWVILNWINASHDHYNAAWVWVTNANAAIVRRRLCIASGL